MLSKLPQNLFDNIQDENFEKKELKDNKKIVEDDGFCNDNDGFLIPKIGEMIQDRYHVIQIAGKGVFSNVLKAIDAKSGDQVAIKVLRCQEIFERAGLRQSKILNELKAADPHDKRCCIKILGQFYWKGHLCLVFESKSMNLREALNKFGKNIGLSLQGVQLFGRQIFTALKFLKQRNLIHCDIKPDNILLDKDEKHVKVADFGSIMHVDEITTTRYLASRFYRAPEIILGLQPYSSQIDVWSASVSLYQLYTGKLLFEGKSNNQMLRLFMSMKGKLSSKLIKRATYGSLYFTENGLFQMEDPKIGIKTITIPSQPSKNIAQMLNLKKVGNDQGDNQRTMLFKFKDFLEKTLIIDPKKRLTPQEALNHPFLSKHFK